MFEPGDVVRFTSVEAGKTKYHICVHLDGWFLFLNSPKQRAYRGDLVVPCSEIPFIPPTPSGDSIISCSLVMHKTATELRTAKAVRVGSISVALLRKILIFVENSPALSEEEKEKVLEGLGDWL